MELSGKIIQVLAEQSGNSQRGPWRKQEYVIEIPGEYPKQVCFMAWGDKIEEFGLQEGQEVTVGIDLQSREYNGRWYTDVKAWRVQAAAGQNGAEGPPPNDGQAFEARGESPPDFDDDVPF